MRRVLLLIMLLMVGCSSERGVSVESLKDLDGVALGEMSNTGVHFRLGATIKNTYKSKVQIKAAEFTVESGGKTLAKVFLTEGFVLDPETSEYHIISARVRIGQSTMTQLFERLEGLNEAKIYGYVLARKGIFQKKVKVEYLVNRDEIDKFVHSARSSKVE